MNNALPVSVLENLPQWRQFAETLADRARDITGKYFRAAIPVELKDDQSPVTLADRETEAMLRKALMEAYPDHGIIGEEFGRHNAEAGLCWVVDPIDGTRAFMAGIPTFVTLIALTYQGVPILGLIDQPILKERWCGIAGEGTYYNGDRIKITDTTMPASLGKAMLATTATDLFPQEAAAAFNRLREACGNMACGGDGYLYGRLACGIPHIVCEYGLKPHDFAALVPVIEGAGGMVTDWHGKPLTLTSDGSMLAAVNAELHAQALKGLHHKA